MEDQKNLRCWNYNDCGHEKDSLCPAVDRKAGRSCWLVSKTLCGGKVHGRHRQRIKACEGCSFYIYIHTMLARLPLADKDCSDMREVKSLCSNLARG